MASQNSIPAGITREMTDAKELADHAIYLPDYFDGTRFFLVTWPDRSGWYSKADDAEIYLATVGNESEEFETVAEVEAFLWARVEVTS